MQALCPSKPVVLVVEDETLIAMMVEDILTTGGYRPVTAYSGEAALVLAPSCRPAAAVLDLKLGSGMDGRQVLRQLRQAYPDMPAVVLTGFHAGAPQADLRGLGGPTTRLQKPCEDDDLLAVLAEVLRRPAGQPHPSRRGSRLSAA